MNGPLPRGRRRAAHLERHVDAATAGLLEDDGGHFHLGRVSDVDAAIGAESSRPFQPVLGWGPYLNDVFKICPFFTDFYKLLRMTFMNGPFLRISYDNFCGSGLLRQRHEVEPEHARPLYEHRLAPREAANSLGGVHHGGEGAVGRRRHFVGDAGGDPEHDGSRVQVDVLRVAAGQVGPLRRGGVTVLGDHSHMTSASAVGLGGYPKTDQNCVICVSVAAARR